MPPPNAHTIRDVLITGATGYIGRPLGEALVGHGHRVSALVRPSSMARVSSGVTALPGDALDASAVAAALVAGATLVHLVGTPHPSPAKAASFIAVDLASIRASVEACRRAGALHLIYLSVAHPAPVMQAYIDVRSQGEAMIAQAGLTATILRPWYVLGPGHRWPLVLVPFAKLAETLPATRATALRLGFVTREQMVSALTVAVESPPPTGTQRVLDVPAIRAQRIDATPR
jgi:uncharacterized protein YbjT (DUF2867 family)